MQNVLVLDQVAQTLAVVRSLGRAGYRVILGRGRARGEAERSRYCAEVWVHPAVDEPAFGGALDAFLDARPDVRAIFPVGDQSIASLGRIASLQARGVVVASVAPTLCEACRDKRLANDLAKAAGLHTPDTAVVRDLDGLRAFAARVGFPVIVKPLRSVAKVLGRKAYILRDAGMLAAQFGKWPSEHDELLVQRYVAGPLEQCDFLAMDGDVIAFFQAHAVRTDRPDGTGMAVDFLSDQVDPDVLAACRAFARAHRYTGPGLLQLVRSEADGNLYFIENNPRLAAGIAQPIACGVNFPLLMLQAALRTVPTQAVTDTARYGTGQRTHWLSRDLNGYLDARRELDAAERGRWRRDILESLRRAHDHMTWDRGDPLPSFYIYGRLLSRWIRSARRAA